MTEREISLDAAVYEALMAETRDEESVSDTVERLLGSEGTSDPFEPIVGMLDDDEVRRVREHVRAFRDDLDDQMDRYSKSS